MICDNCGIKYNSKLLGITMTIEGTMYHFDCKQCFDYYSSFEIGLVQYGKLTKNNDLMPVN